MYRTGLVAKCLSRDKTRKESRMPGLLKTSNPALNAKTFEGHVAVAGEAMTLQGTVNKTGFLLFCASATAAYTWHLVRVQPESVAAWMWGGLIGGLVFALVTIFKKEWSPVTATIYALCEGLALGGISAVLNTAYPGIAIEALGLTAAVTVVMLLLYTCGIFLFYMIDLVMGFFGHHISLLYSNGPVGIGIGVLIVIVAALNLILDFDFVETGVHAGAAKYMEWYGAFGIMVTLVWMYVEMLRLLSKIRSR